MESRVGYVTQDSDT